MNQKTQVFVVGGFADGWGLGMHGQGVVRGARVDGIAREYADFSLSGCSGLVP